jgi:hypothetical protein
VEFAGDLPGVSLLRTGLAPAQPGAVVGTHARGLGELLLHPDPVGRHTPVRGFQDHRGAALSDAVDVQAVVTHIDQLTGRGIGALVYLRGYYLVDRPDNGEGEEPGDHPHEPAPDPKSRPSPSL